ncbi:DUF2399 domain-containing protein [Massilia scottii]|uniref:DUF2399 domain-containing protein n=1 Tax=Massilia scottii TaxID=3057166 RepID=UPI002796518D|nr:DUF2399 domain-containing protein [Massilia sp. CCM 9029]MDQ1833711.1 DUF2399 domain-containing protein [Massilia sp. CCM 9029]
MHRHDWAGLHIGNYVMRDFGAHPWRFSAPDYLAAVHVAPGLNDRPGQRQRRRLAGRETDAPWDKDLSAAMRQHKLAIPEEAVADALLCDLHD